MYDRYKKVIFPNVLKDPSVPEDDKRRIRDLMQKPFSMSAMVDIVENREAYEGLKTLMSTARDVIKDLDNPSSDQIKYLFEGLRKVQKFKGF
jgi:hypothetical protein